MNHPKALNRRQFLSLMGASAALAWTGVKPASAAVLERKPQGFAGSADFTPDVEIALCAVETKVPILPGSPTRVWSYQGELLKGDPTNLQALPDSYLGPTIRVQTGQDERRLGR
jgi:FtsP/CotA-like multicopper oxidase with cupredoxin domain